MVSQISVGTSPMIRLGLGLYFFTSVMAFDMTLNTNLAVYWGQNSYGATNPTDTAAWQQPIDFYCGDNTIDSFPVAFLTEFSSTSGGTPTIDLANTCSVTGNGAIGGTSLANCTFLTAGIEACQQAGKIVTMSIGGATGSVGFTSDSEGQAYAQVIWDIFLGGSSTTRPFGTAVLDGIDMDIEGGSQTGYTAFLTALRSLMDGGDKPYYITAAPQCPYPDANLGATMNAFGFDAVYVQFYNNYCGLTNYDNTNDWDFSAWDEWAKNTSPNKNVKVYIGAPASSSAAGSGYVSSSTLATIISQTKSQYSSFGGVMLWDASQAYANGRYDQAVKAALTGSSASPVSSAAATTTSSGKATTTSSGKATTTSSGRATTAQSSVTSSGQVTTSAPPSPSATATGSCAGVSPWENNVTYNAGDQVTYNNQLYTAVSWSENTEPDLYVNAWTPNGPC